MSPAGRRRLHAERHATHGPGWPWTASTGTVDHRRQHQRHRHGEQAGDGFGDGGKRQAADAGCGREPAECDARHRGRRHARQSRSHPRCWSWWKGLAGTPSDSDYTVALTSEPTGQVTVTVTRAGGLTVATASNPQDSDFATSKTLTFTTSNWQTARTVTLRAGADSDTTDNTYTIGHTASGGGLRQRARQPFGAGSRWPEERRDAGADRGPHGNPRGWRRGGGEGDGDARRLQPAAIYGGAVDSSGHGFGLRFRSQYGLDLARRVIRLQRKPSRPRRRSQSRRSMTGSTRVTRRSR